MVYLLSKSKKKTKGVIVFNVDEKDFFRRKIIEKIYRSEIQDLKKKYFFLMHWSWALRNERDIPHIDYHLASESGRFINRKKNKIVNFCNRNFIDKIFKEKKLTKIYDVISVIRPVHFKNLKHLFKAASQIYKKKIYPNFLVIFTINSDKEFYNSPEFFYTDLIKDYNHFIKKEHRKHFTLLPISTFNHQYQLHKEQICNFLKTGAISNAVNTFSLSAKEYNLVKPYLRLSNLLGSFAGQLTENAIKKIELEFEGQASKVNTQPLLQTLICSLLKPTFDNVNIINAMSVVKDKSIDVTETKHDRVCEYQSCITLSITTDKQKRSVKGTLFGNKPRIVSIKGIKIEAELLKHNLYISNEDKPGFVSNLSKILADNNINIATFHLGRKDSGGEAVALISTDNFIDNSVIGKIKKLPLVIQAKYITFDD